MSNLYANAGQLLLTGQIDWSAPSSPWAVALVTSADYSPDFAADQYLSAIATDAIVATSDLTAPTATAGVASAANVTVPSVSGGEVDMLVIYQNTGVAATSTLIACMTSGTGLPFTPVGSNIDISWDPAAGIFTL